MKWASVALLFIFARGVTPRGSGVTFPQSVLSRFPRDLASGEKLNDALVNEEEPARELKRYVRELWSPWQYYPADGHGWEPEVRTTGAGAGLTSLFSYPEVTSHSTSGLIGGGVGGLGHGHSLLGVGSSLLGASSSLLGGSQHGGGEWSGQIHEPAHGHTYFTKVPYISGYKLSPIYSEKKIIVKDVALGGGGVLGHHGPKTGDDVATAALATEYVRNPWEWAGLPAVSSSVQPVQPMYFVPTAAVYPPQTLNGVQPTNRFASNENNGYYLSGPGLTQPINLNSFFLDPAQLKEAQEQNCDNSIQDFERVIEQLEYT